MAGIAPRTSVNDAPEVDRAISAPQHHPIAEGLQLHEKSGEGLNSPAKKDPPYSNDAAFLRQNSKKKHVLIAILVFAVAIAIALGVGLGVGLKQREVASVPSSTTISPSMVSVSPTSMPSATSAPTPKHGILNDSSITAVTTVEGNKHIFFQDINGSLRHTVFSQFAKSWADEADFLSTATTPQNHTPIAAIEFRFGNNTDEIHVFFINTKNLLAAVLYSPTSVIVGSPNPMNNSFPASAASRTLSISSMQLSQNGTYAEAILMYEAPSGNITTLRGYFSTSGFTSTIWLWQNVSEAIYEPVNNAGSWFSPPLASSCNPGFDQSSQTVYIYFFNPNALSDKSACPLYCLQFVNWTGLLPDLGDPSIGPAQLPNLDTVPNNATQEVRASDIITFWFDDDASNTGAGDGDWAFVQNETLITDFYGLTHASYPSTLYPYMRLAWLNDSQTGATFIYHQIDNAVFVEDAFYATGGWHTTNITIGTSN